MSEKIEENFGIHESALFVKLKLGEEVIHELMVSWYSNLARKKWFFARTQDGDLGIPLALLPCQLPLRISREKA